MIKPPKWKIRGKAWQLSDSTLSADSMAISTADAQKEENPILPCRAEKGIWSVIGRKPLRKQ